MPQLEEGFQVMPRGGEGGPLPPGVFLEVFILKGFKSCVLEVRILRELRVSFPEVRILKGIVASDEW